MSIDSHSLSLKMHLKLQLNIDGNCVQHNGQNFRLRHHRAALFLASLIEAAERGAALSKEEFLASWATLDPQASPDRTAISRIVQSVSEVLDLLFQDSNTRLLVPSRGLTTGPWRLQMQPHESWSVEHSKANLLEPEPVFTQSLSPLEWCNVANHLAIVDATTKAGLYLEATALIEQQPATYSLSDAGWCIWAMRLVRTHRRLGKTAASLEILSALCIRAQNLPLRQKAYFLNEATLLQARSDFDSTPSKASLNIDFERLRASIDAAPNSALQWEWCNLRALSIRRQIHHQLQISNESPLCVDLANEMVTTFGAAYFWAAAAKDQYHCQAIACNFAYTLHWLDERNLYAGLEASVAWFRLAHTLVDRFDLPQDSAWDFLMVGELYLSSSKARALVAGDVLSWPEQTNPSKDVFYLRAIELAEQFGDPRQQIMALNQRVGFLKRHAQKKLADLVAIQRDTLMAQHAATVTALEQDRFDVF
jgi:hypothetical protein